jgi:hypothetical protein
LTEDEARAWKSHPETFFGEVRRRPDPVKNSLDLFEFFESTLAEASRDELLAQMKGWPNQAELRDMPRDELVRQRAYALTAWAIQKSPLPGPPEWMRRLNRSQGQHPPEDDAAGS